MRTSRPAGTLKRSPSKFGVTRSSRTSAARGARHRQSSITVRRDEGVLEVCEKLDAAGDRRHRAQPLVPHKKRGDVFGTRGLSRTDHRGPAHTGFPSGKLSPKVTIYAAGEGGGGEGRTRFPCQHFVGMTIDVDKGGRSWRTSAAASGPGIRPLGVWDRAGPRGGCDPIVAGRDRLRARRMEYILEGASAVQVAPRTSKARAASTCRRDRAWSRSAGSDPCASRPLVKRHVSGKGPRPSCRADLHGESAVVRSRDARLRPSVLLRWTCHVLVDSQDLRQQVLGRLRPGRRRVHPRSRHHVFDLDDSDVQMAARGDPGIRLGRDLGRGAPDFLVCLEESKPAAASRPRASRGDSRSRSRAHRRSRPAAARQPPHPSEYRSRFATHRREASPAVVYALRDRSPVLSALRHRHTAHCTGASARGTAASARAEYLSNRAGSPTRGGGVAHRRRRARYDG